MKSPRKQSMRPLRPMSRLTGKRHFDCISGSRKGVLSSRVAGMTLFELRLWDVPLFVAVIPVAAVPLEVTTAVLARAKED